MKIVLWKIGALGDVLMTTPLVSQLREAYPDAEIDYLVGRSSAIVLNNNPYLDRVIPFDEKILYERKLTELGKIIGALRGYDAVFVLDKHWIFSLLARAANVPQRIGFARTWFEGVFHTRKVPYGPVRHEIDYYLGLGRLFGVPSAMVTPRMALPPAVTYPLDPPYTVLVNSGGAHIFERSSVRRMPPALFEELVQECSASGKVVFLGSAAERDDYEKYATASTMNLCGKTSLPEAWHILAHAEKVYATDTGLMHMAAAVNARLTAVFGPTHPLRKCPPGASWVWADVDVYEAGYELFGRIPRGEYFRKLTAREILVAADHAIRF